MQNRRAISRYHLVRPLRGYIEHGEARYPGEVVELSTAGFRLRLPGTSREAFTTAQSGHDLGELIYKDQEIGGFGEIRYVRAEGGDLWIGFKWDDIHATENIQRSFAAIADLVAQGIAGCINVKAGLVELVGHASGILAEDIWQCLDRTSPRLSLRECSSIDASGVSMLSALERTGVCFEDASLDILAQLQRYRQTGRVSAAPLEHLLAA
jgi:hypothetical protein